MLWGISWLNVQIMLTDALKTKSVPKDEKGKPEDKIIRRDLKTKEDIKNYIKGII